MIELELELEFTTRNAHDIPNPIAIILEHQSSPQEMNREMQK